MGIENDFKCLCPPGFTGYTLSEWFIHSPINPKYDIRLLRDLPEFFCCEPVFVQNPKFKTLPGRSIVTLFLLQLLHIQNVDYFLISLPVILISKLYEKVLENGLHYSIHLFTYEKFENENKSDK